MRKAIQRFAIIIVALLLHAAHAQQHIENTVHGYTIEIPDGWNVASDEFLTRFSRIASGPNQRLRYVGAYQGATFDNGLVYPYVLVQVIPYTDFGLGGRPTQEQRAEIIDKLTGLDVRKAVDESGSEVVKGLIEGAPVIGNLEYDNWSERYTYDLRVAVAGIGNVKTSVHGTFGEWAILQAAYSAMDDEWPTYEEEAGQILESFQSLSNTPKPDYTATSIQSRFMRGALRGAVGGLIVGAALALIAATVLLILRKRSTPKPPPL